MSGPRLGIFYFKWVTFKRQKTYPNPVQDLIECPGVK